MNAIQHQHSALRPSLIPQLQLYVGAGAGLLGDCICVQPLLPVCQCRSTVDGWVVTAASYLTPLHLALSMAPTPCLLLEWPVSVADCNNTTWNVQVFIAADIRASRLVFITTAVVSGTLTIPGRSFYCPGTHSSSGTRTPGYPLTGLMCLTDSRDIVTNRLIWKAASCHLQTDITS